MIFTEGPPEPRTTSRDPSAALAEMAADPDIRREIDDINAEFSVTEMDGLREGDERPARRSGDASERVPREGSAEADDGIVRRDDVPVLAYARARGRDTATDWSLLAAAIEHVLVFGYFGSTLDSGSTVQLLACASAAFWSGLLLFIRARSPNAIAARRLYLCSAFPLLAMLTLVISADFR